MRRRGMMADSGWRDSGGKSVGKTGSRAAVRRGTLRGTGGRRKIRKNGSWAAMMSQMQCKTYYMIMTTVVRCS